jgi:hypothetical protein
MEDQSSAVYSLEFAVRILFAAVGYRYGFPGDLDAPMYNRIQLAARFFPRLQNQPSVAHV